jgi:hypothetical protein
MFLPVMTFRFGSRASILTGAPRAATSPVCAILNYLYDGILAAEARLALLAQGLDPTLGVLHADQPNRDSFALDAMEPIRPDVDAFVLDMLEDRVFTSRDFAELPNGVCRLCSPVTHDLALTLPHWRMLMQPIAARLAQAFRSSNVNQRTAPRINGLGPAHVRSPRPASKHSPLVATPRKTSQPRPYASKEWSTPRPEGLARSPIACAVCGEPVMKRRRRHCEECMPQVRRAQGLRAIAAARKALAAQSRRGKDPRASREAGRKRGAANAEHHRRNREWKREHGQDARRDREWFLREVAPKLDAFSLADIARATGLSLAACSRFRAGMRVPHPRHWDRFLALMKRGKQR